MQVECAMWALLVVVPHIDAEYALELTAVEDEQPVEALSSCAADPALDVRIRVRCLQRVRMTLIPAPWKTASRRG